MEETDAEGAGVEGIQNMRVEEMPDVGKDRGESCVRIRPMESRDLEAVADLEQASFTVPWSECLVADCLESRFDKVWVLEADGVIKGYCNMRVIAGEGELMRIAVSPDARGRGYARDLMETLVSHARKNGIHAVTLEVRASNLAAVNLYKSYGFEIQAVRKSYYTHPTEDALIMWNRAL